MPPALAAPATTLRDFAARSARLVFDAALLAVALSGRAVPGASWLVALTRPTASPGAAADGLCVVVVATTAPATATAGATSAARLTS